MLGCLNQNFKSFDFICRCLMVTGSCSPHRLDRKNTSYFSLNIFRLLLFPRSNVLHYYNISRTYLTWNDQNQGPKIEVKYRNEPCNACYGYLIGMRPKHSNNPTADNKILIRLSQVNLFLIRHQKHTKLKCIK